MTQATGDSADRARPSLLADARTSMGDLVLLVVGESRMAQLGWAAEIALVPRPKTGPIGGEPLRDRELLEWTRTVIDTLVPAVVAPSVSVGGGFSTE